jgi:hypothetical protein
MATIAKTSILMSLNAAGLVSGLNSAHKRVQSFGSSIANISRLVGAAAVVFGGAATVGGMVAWAKSTVDQIDRLDELSIKTGISAEALSRMGYAAKFSGIDMETLAGNIGKMEKQLVASQSKASIFTAMGLDARKLASMKPDAAFLEVAEAIAQIPNPMDRAAAAMEVFGKSGADMLPFLTAGKAGIAELMAEADKLGVTIGTKDAIQVANLADSMDRMASAGQGAMNQIVIQAAPFVTAILDSVTNWLKSTPGIVYGVTYAFETVLSSIATAADYLSLLDAGVLHLQAGFASCFASALDGLASLIDGINYLVGSKVGALLFGGFQIDPAILRDMAKGMDELSVDLTLESEQAFRDFTTGANAAKVHAFFDDIRNKANAAAQATANTRDQTQGFSKDLAGLVDNANKVNDILEKLREEVAEFGLTEAEKTQAQLQQLGASPEQLRQAQQLADQLDALNRNKKMDEDAAKIKENILTPAEKAKKEIEQITELFNAGKLSWDEYGRAVRAVQKDMATPEVSAPDLYVSASQESQRLLLDLQRGTGLDNNDDKMLAETQKQTGVLFKIEKKLTPPSEFTAVKLPA